jgi:hypothetical protein
MLAAVGLYKAGISSSSFLPDMASVAIFWFLQACYMQYASVANGDILAALQYWQTAQYLGNTGRPTSQLCKNGRLTSQLRNAANSLTACNFWSSWHRTAWKESNLHLELFAASHSLSLWSKEHFQIKLYNNKIKNTDWSAPVLLGSLDINYFS